MTNRSASKRTKSGLCLALCIGALICAGTTSPPVGAAQPHCGSPVTRDLTLHANLTGCAGRGLLIAADGVTVDLNGHTIAGAGVVGIDNTAGHDRVTVTSRRGRGKIDGFLNGVSVLHGADNRIRNLAAEQISVANSSEGVIADNRLLRGVSLARAHQVRVVGNDVRGLSVSTIEVHHSSRILVKGNDVFNGHRGVWFIDTDHSRVRGNKVNMADEPAIWLTHQSDHNRVARNLLHPSFGGGFCGIDLQASSRNRVLHNVVRGGAVGIAAGQPDEFFAVPPFGRGVSHHNAIIENVARGSDTGVMASRENSDHTLIEGNLAKLGGQGLRAGSPSTTFKDNLVKMNVGHGISAVRGVENSGGNVAVRNDGRPQCVHLRCRTVPPGT